MATHYHSGTEYAPNNRLARPVLVEVFRSRETLSWVITAVIHRPTERELQNYDEVHRLSAENHMYWICVRGGTLSRDAALGLMESHLRRDKGWVNYDLRQFD